MNSTKTTQTIQSQNEDLDTHPKKSFSTETFKEYISILIISIYANISLSSCVGTVEE